MKGKKVLLILPILSIIAYFCAGILYKSEQILFIKPIIIPSFLLYIIATSYTKLSYNYYIYSLLFYINEFLLLFYQNSIHLYRAALLASLFCYLALTNLGYNFIKNKTIFKFPKGYTLFIYSLNISFLMVIVYILIDSISDIFLNIILVFNAISAILLGIIAVICLSKFTENKMYYYFFGAYALIFSDVFGAINIYYVENNFLNSLDRILHFASFFLIYKFTTTDKKIEKQIKTEAQRTR